MKRSDILTYLETHKADFQDKYGILSIGLFGSYARGEETEESDIDIAIELKKEKKNIHTFLALKREMENVFKTKVDLGIESSLKPIAKERIKKEIIYV